MASALLEVCMGGPTRGVASSAWVRRQGYRQRKKFFREMTLSRLKGSGYMAHAPQQPGLLWSRKNQPDRRALSVLGTLTTGRLFTLGVVGGTCFTVGPSSKEVRKILCCYKSCDYLTPSPPWLRVKLFPNTSSAQ